MAQFTTNYSLPLVPRDERIMTFLEWRTLVNGTEQTSAMNIIDAQPKTLESKCGEAAAGFRFNPDTGVLQLVTAEGTPIEGASVTINLANYYTKDEVDTKLNDYVTATQLSEAVNDVDLANYYTKEEALSKEEAASDYQTKQDAADKYLTKADAASSYLTKTEAATNYLSQTNADNYLTKSEASQTYVTATELEDALENIDPGSSVDLSTLAQNSSIGLAGDINTIEKIKTAVETASIDAQSALSNSSDSYVSYEYDETEHKLTFITAGNERSAPITITGGGGGGGTAYSMKLSNLMGTRNISTTQNSQCVLQFVYYLYYQ